MCHRKRLLPVIYHDDFPPLYSLPIFTIFRAKMPAYYFDRASRTCRLFFYGGCGGNENRFETLADCAAACEVDGAAMRAVRDVCQSPPERGSCDAKRARYFYNAERFRCENFGACPVEGEVNNFATRDECLVRCQFSLKNGGVIASSDSPLIQV